MKMKRPKSVNILGHEWKIKYVDEKKLPPRSWGMCTYPDRTIHILNKKMCKTMFSVTLLHECRHAWQFESGFSNILDNQAMEIDADSYASFSLSLKKQGFI